MTQEQRIELLEQKFQNLIDFLSYFKEFPEVMLKKMIEDSPEYAEEYNRYQKEVKCQN